MENDEWIPVTTTLSPATEAIIKLVKCKREKERCSTNRCHCRKAGLPCTDLCSCSEDDDKSENQPGECDDDDDDSDIEDQEDDDDAFDKLLQTFNIVICNILFQPRFHARKSRDHFIISRCH